MNQNVSIQEILGNMLGVYWPLIRNPQNTFDQRPEVLETILSGKQSFLMHILNHSQRNETGLLNREHSKHLQIRDVHQAPHEDSQGEQILDLFDHHADHKLIVDLTVQIKRLVYIVMV
jgi:hypothetical protein